MPSSLRPHGLQHARFPGPLLCPKVYTNLCSLSQWCHPMISSSDIPFSCRQYFPVRVFPNELALYISWPKYWNLSFSISPSSECSVLISFRTDWFDLLAVQGMLTNLLQHHNSKASILQCSAFFTVQLSHPYVTTGNTIALTMGHLSAKWCLCFLKRCLGLS